MVPEENQYNPACFLPEEKEKTSSEMSRDFKKIN